MEEKASFGAVIKNPGFINLWTNQILVQLSYNSLNFALIIWVFRLTNSNTAVSLLLFAVYLPAVLLGLFAGVLVDAVDRKKIILAIDCLLAVLFFLLLFLKQTYPAILVVTFLINTMSQFYTPAESSSIPLLVKPSQLLAANSLFTVTLFLTFLVGYSLSGPFIALFGIDFVFLVGTSLLAIAFILATRFPSITTPPDQMSERLLDSIEKRNFPEMKSVLFSEVKETLGMIRGRLPISSSILILSAVQAIIGVLAVLVPSFLERVLQISATDATYVMIAPLGLGMVLGSLFIGKFGHRFPKRRLVGGAIIVAGIILFLIGGAPLVSPAIKYFPRAHPLPFFHQPSLSKILTIGSFLLGLAMVSILIPSQTVLQEATPKEDRGKVFATLAVAMSSVSLLPVLFAGILADIFGTMPIFIGLGGIIFIFGLFTLKPDFFFEEKHLPLHIREFLGLGHWDSKP